MGPPPPRLGSFRYHFEQRSKERLPLLSSLKDVDWGNFDLEDDGGGRRCFRRARDGISWIWGRVAAMAVAGWEMARSDPRNLVFAAKMGLALAVISLLIFLKEPLPDLSSHSVWAILTVVVVFEFSIGKLLPFSSPSSIGAFDLMLRVDSGLVSSDIDDNLYRLGGSTQLSGEKLPGLSQVLGRYLNRVEYERVPSKILTYQASDDPLYSGYRAAVESKAQEDALFGFAIWEPPHGRYKMFKYPWKSYVKVSGALRHCAFMVMTLHGCILSEIQVKCFLVLFKSIDSTFRVDRGRLDVPIAPSFVLDLGYRTMAPLERRQVFRSELQRVGIEGTKVLQELGHRVKTMTKINSSEILLEVHDAAEELQRKIDRRSYLLVNSELWEIGRRPEVGVEAVDPINTVDTRPVQIGIKSPSEAVLDNRSLHLSRSWDVHSAGTGCEPILKQQISWPVRPSFSIDDAPLEEESRTYESASALSLATFSSLLIEFVARLQNVVNAFEELSEEAKFKEPADEPGTDSAPGLWTRIKKFFGF
ncbi:Aluminum-activated malate transporter 9 [Apostasia shenzhenica]|uniref:Aluminum-activated malate transporter 9 n=1 Tax=Apostasia shenzhenica TaxID=1088818 RepID=A0A2I0B4J5_9ASPA|nr:Aluminum-activated malate transporter 9 [Apostasia shenzhenica]